MQTSTTIAAILAPLLGPVIWGLLHLPGRIAARLVWKYMPYGRLRDLLLRESDPFAAKPRAPRPSVRLQPSRRPRQ